MPKGHDNERLEFLGDAVVDLAVSEFLYAKFPDSAEGALATMRAQLVRAESLARAARRIGLGRFLRVGRGEEKAGARSQDSLLSDAFEAVAAAVYLEKGWEAATAFVLNALSDALARLSGPTVDPKTELQEKLQAIYKQTPTYRLVRESGPDHDKRFECVVEHRGDILGKGEGPSKKSAEQAAAQNALKRFR